MKKYVLLFCCISFCLHSVSAQFKPILLPWDPRCITVDTKDNLYIEFEKMLLKVSADGTASYISENIANGFRGAVSPDAEIMIADSDGNILMTKSGLNSIWKLTPEGKFIIHAAAEGYQNAWAEAAKKTVDLASIEFMVIDKKNTIYFSDRYNHSSTSVFYRLSTDNKQKIIKTKTGDTIKISHVTAITVDEQENLYVATVKERCIKKISPSGEVTVVAGQCGKRDICPVYTQGDVRIAELVQPGSMLFNKKGELFFADERMNRIIKVSNNKVSTVAGASIIQPCGSNMGGRSKEGFKDGAAATALFNFPEKVRLAIDSKDNIYILDLGNNAVRKLTPDGIVTTIAVTAKAGQTPFTGSAYASANGNAAVTNPSSANNTTAPASEQTKKNNTAAVQSSKKDPAQTKTTSSGSKSSATPFDPSQPVYDLDSNQYTVLKIGNQFWLKENLRTTKYNDTTSIPTGLNDSEWKQTKQGAYTVYENKSQNEKKYGKLYNGYAVITGKLCPRGWRIPTDKDWNTLEQHLGVPAAELERTGERGAIAFKLKTKEGWKSSPFANDNTSNFSIVPAGSRLDNGEFTTLGQYGNFWSSSVYDDRYGLLYLWNHHVHYNTNAVGRIYTPANNGYSCRCIKETEQSVKNNKL